MSFLRRRRGGPALVRQDGHHAPGRASLDRACTVHAAVRHPVIVRPVQTTNGPAGPTLVYPWYDGDVLNHATAHGADCRGLARFQQLPVPQVEAALDAILDAHLAVSAAGFVAVDLYDGCFLYDFPTERMRLIDLDEYRPGPFVLDADRLPGSCRYMAPEEFCQWRGDRRADHSAPARPHPGPPSRLCEGLAGQRRAASGRGAGDQRDADRSVRRRASAGPRLAVGSDLTPPTVAQRPPPSRRAASSNS